MLLENCPAKKLKAFIFVVGVTLVCVGGLTAQVAAPRAIKIPDPEYPPEALQAHRGGDVFVTVRVSKKGKVAVGDAYGPMAPCSKLDDRIPKLIRKAAREAAAKATFEPGTKDGKPADVGLELKYVFDPDKKLGEKPKDPYPFVRSGIVNGLATRLTRPDHPGKNRLWESVVIDVLVDETGTVIAAMALSNQTPFTIAGIDAACRSKFTPVVQSGHPVKFTGKIRYDFAPAK